jgi:MFS family permease
LGGVLEFYDFIIFVFFANTIGELFFPPGIPEWVRQLQTFGIFAAGYLDRPLGGIVMAHAGDLRGRKQMFTLSVFLMALPTLGIGLLPTYANLGAWAAVLLLYCASCRERPLAAKFLAPGCSSASMYPHLELDWLAVC